MTITNKSRNFKLLCLILTMIFVISGFPSMALASELNGPDCCVVEDGNSFKVTNSVTSSWKNHANVDFTFTNTGDRAIHNWYFTFNLLYNIDNIWNARIIEKDETGTYTIGNSIWKQDIPVGSSITVGMTLSSETEESLTVMPSWYLLNTTTKSVDAANYTITYQEQSSWDSGFTGALLLQPSINISDWSISCSATREITSISSAKITDNGNGNYTIFNDGNNQNISGGSSYYIGIQGKNNTAAFSLSSVTLTIVDLALTLHDDSNNNGIADYLDAIRGGAGEEPEVTPTVAPTVTPEPTIEPTVVPTDVPTATPTTAPDTELDSDMDGIPDYIEEEIGTDVINPDSDADGLTDGMEVILGYNPLSNDTDTNGIPDGDEDFDSDGLTNLQEIELGTEITSYDTDGDGLSDGNEVNIYGTDPLKYDTDEDGISDGEEIDIGKDPNDASDEAIKVLQTVTTDIYNEDDPAITAVDITLATEGCIDYVAYAEDLYNIDTYSTDVAGRIGSPFELYSSVDFDTATVTIHYDDTQLGDTSEEDLGVLWYDEESGFYITQDQAVVDTANNTVTVALEHFSTYVLVDLQKWNNIEPIKYVAPVVEQNYDFYFALDVSQNMTIEARLRALSTLQDFVSNMRSGDRVCIIYFDTSYYVYNLPINVENQDDVAAMMSLAEQNLKTASLGGSYGSYLLPFQVTEGLINNYVQDIGNKKALYILSNDTETVHALNYSDEMMSRMQSGGFIANFVMMDNKGEGQWNFGWKYAAETGSNYYGYEQSVNLWNQFYSLYGQKDGWDIDNDGDGLPDMVENQGMMGTNKKIYFSDPSKIDTDGDGLTDGEEIGQKYTFTNQFENGVSNPVMIPSNPVNAKKISSYYPKNINTNAYYFATKSDPTLGDTDKDGMKDNKDSYPTDYQLDMIYILYLDDNGNNVSDGKLFYDTYRSFNLNCRLYGFNGTNIFIDAWDRIGRKESSAMISSDEYYNITDVVIVSEGNVNGIELSSVAGRMAEHENWLLARSSSCIGTVANIGISDLSDKNIENLHLRTCATGSIYREGACFPNLAEEIISTNNDIENVYAFDCNLEVLRFKEKYTLLGVTETSEVWDINGNDLPLPWGLESNVFQQCWYSWKEIPTPPISIYCKEINGITISCKDCYFNDYDMQFISKQDGETRFLGPTAYEYHHDPILQRYGYDF